MRLSHNKEDGEGRRQTIFYSYCNDSILNDVPMGKKVTKQGNVEVI